MMDEMKFEIKEWILDEKRSEETNKLVFISYYFLSDRNSEVNDPNLYSGK